MKNLFSNAYKNKKVLITGHTGFKGSWLSLWLTKLGAKILGYALDPPTDPNHISLLNLDIKSVIGDIRDLQKLNNAINRFKPEIIFHMAAQPLVRPSYKDPVETFETNVMGTINLYEACRKTDSVKAIINITSDKCYENKEWVWGYRENDPMGGYDPYSASKGCSEIVTSSYRNSFFNLDRYGKDHNVLLASVRAGNVAGGGDWSEDRLIPDIMKAVSTGQKVIIRSPHATRPWQHVLEPLSGYLHLGQKLIEKNKNFAEAWNFGPSDEGSITVGEVVNAMKSYWGKIDYTAKSNENNLHEANLLKLDCSKANTRLKWKGIWNSDTTFQKTANWYKEYYENNSVISASQLEDYIKDAIKAKIEWAR